MAMGEPIFLMALSLVPGLGPVSIKQLIAYFGTAEAVFKAPKGKLKKVPGIGETLSNEIWKKETLALAEKKWAEAANGHFRLLFYYEEEYPTLLKEIPDAPIFLYWKGNASPQYIRSLAIVGTRQSTDYGNRITEEIVADLLPYQPTVISGFAYGIDIVAHKAALKHRLPTLAVLGGGLHKIYPAQHQRYVQDLLQNGALVTEYDPDTTPEAAYFPARNRIVAGMSQAVLVVEAAKEGGALITAELANGYHREVFAVPGNLGNKYSEGCNRLIAENKASIYTGPEDLAQYLGWAQDGKSPAKRVLPEPLNLSGDEQKVYRVLKDGNETQVDQLAWKSQLTLNELASVLLTMELKGLVKAMPGKKYTLC